MLPRSHASFRLLLAWVVLTFLAAVPGRAAFPYPPYGPPQNAGPIPGLFVGSDSRGYPYYSGFRYYPAYPLYRAYPDYLGDPMYPRLSYGAGAQPRRPNLLAFFGLHPALWSFPDYYSGNYPSYYGATPDYRGTPADSPPPLAAPGAGPMDPVYEDANGVPVPGASAPLETSAAVTVQAPANAEVWVEGRKTTASGSVRRFHTPPLTPGSRYTYDVTARWEENGRPMMQRQSVSVTAGATAEVVFAPEAVAAVGSK